MINMSTIKNQKMRIAKERRQNNMNFHSKVQKLDNEEYTLKMRIRTVIADIVPIGRENAQTASELITKIPPDYMSKNEFIAYLSNCKNLYTVITKTTGGRYRIYFAKEWKTRYFYEYNQNGDRIGDLITKRELITVYYLMQA